MEESHSRSPIEILRYHYTSLVLQDLTIVRWITNTFSEKQCVQISNVEPSIGAINSYRNMCDSPQLMKQKENSKNKQANLVSRTDMLSIECLDWEEATEIQ